MCRGPQGEIAADPEWRHERTRKGRSSWGRVHDPGFVVDRAPVSNAEVDHDG